MDQNYQWTVRCFSDKAKTKHFIQKGGPGGAVAYANKLLAAGEKAKIYPYSSPKRAIDYIAERGPNG